MINETVVSGTLLLLTEVSGVDRVEHGAVDLVQGVGRVNGELLNFLPILGVHVVVVTIGPEPELGVGVEAMAEHRDRVQGLHKVPDVLGLWLGEGLGAAIRLRTLVVTHTFIKKSFKDFMH